MSKAESVIYLDVFFIMLLSAFGFSNATTGPTFASLQSIPSPTLAPLPGKISCAWWDFLCTSTGSAGLATATAYIGWAIVNGPVLIIYFAIVGISFANIVLALAFSPQLSVKGVPYFGIIFFGLQTYIIFEALRFFRGQAGSAGI